MLQGVANETGGHDILKVISTIGIKVVSLGDHERVEVVHQVAAAVDAAALVSCKYFRESCQRNWSRRNFSRLCLFFTQGGPRILRAIF